MLLGLIGVAIPQSFIFLANELSGPDIVAMMNPSGPVYAALLACAMKLEIMTWCKAFGVLLSVGGALGGWYKDTVRQGESVVDMHST